MLGDEVKRLRLAAGKSQVQLAQAVGVSQGFVQKLEAGQRKGFSPQMMFRLSDALGVTCDHWRRFLPADLPGVRAGPDKSEVQPAAPAATTQPRPRAGKSRGNP